MDANNDELLVAAARCIDAFFAEAKHNKSIVDGTFDLSVGASIDNLSHFIQNNDALKKYR
jgi:hypothetical protein